MHMHLCTWSTSDLGHAGAVGERDLGGGNSGHGGGHGVDVGPHERAGGRLGKGEQADGVLSSVR